jgi:glycosyltransferase involved in cell wall biosynthesis
MTLDRMRTQKDLLVIATEPAPYKTDLFNAFCEAPGWRISVFYVAVKDWSRDAGHDYQQIPVRRYKSSFGNDKGLPGQLSTALGAIKTIVTERPQVILVCGYAGLPYVASLLAASTLRIPFALWADHFNVDQPQQGGVFGRIIRFLIRKGVFGRAFAILVCGRPGWCSAIRAGCPEQKLLDFPYTVDPLRLRRRCTASDSLRALLSRADGRPMVLFSGRLIARKGLDLLLRAAEQLKRENEAFFLIVEGEGPLRHAYERLALELGLAESCVFVGFRQMDEHAYLLSVADIVVVPSTEDPWGIVVHEGMLLGKPVCASDAVGSAIDRITPGENGLLFPSGNWRQLSQDLQLLLHDEDLRRRMGHSAKRVAEQRSPGSNVRSFLALVTARVSSSYR